MITFRDFYDFMKCNKGKLFKVTYESSLCTEKEWQDTVGILLQVYGDGTQGNFRVNGKAMLRFGIREDKIFFWQRDGNEEDEDTINYRTSYEFNLDEGFTHLKKVMRGYYFIENIIWMSFMCVDINK